MAGERLDFDIFARLREDGFAKAAKAAEGASGEVIKLAERLDKLGAKSTEARVGLKGNKEALAQLDALQLKMLKVGDKLIDPKIDIRGEAEAQAKLAALDASLSKLDKTSAGATGSIGAGGLAGPAGMGALIGAGVALSPIIATVATGTAGFGLAAAGSIAPILKASKATGGLQANMAKLNPEQQKLARSILDLGKQYDVFQKALEPQVLNVFGKGIQLAGHLMHDVQPIAAATGKALGGMLSAIDNEFQSGTWQKFFSFMAATAGPDIALITANFTDFMDLLPPLLMDLQPLARALLQTSDAALKVADSVAKAVGSVIRFTDAERRLASEAHNSSGFLGELVHAAERAAGNMIPGAAAGQKLAHAISASGDASTKAASGLDGVVSSLGSAVTAAKSATAAVQGLTDAMNKNLGVVLTLQGDEDGWRLSLLAATKQLDSNSAGLRGNSKNALDNKEAIRQATNSAMTFAEDQITLGRNLGGASKVIQAQIDWLQKHGDKSAFARREIHALRMEEARLHDIRQKLKVTATGSWTVQSGGVPQTGTKPRAARGAYIRTGQPGVDDQLIVAQRGELVVPTAIVNAGLTDHLRGMIPGFAQGGVIGQYSGSVGGLPPWLMKEDAATLRAVDVATAAATAAGIKSAQAAASGGGGFGMPGPGGGAPAANAALARRLHPEVDWPSWNYVAMRESGWSNIARNQSSGAYGIPQALPGSKMGPAANPPQSNPTAQINWMVGYMNGRYQGAPGAAAHERAYGWYADGGVVGDTKPRKHVSAQQQRWLDQLARDVKVLHADQKAAAHRRKILRHSVEIDQLWFLTHPNVRKHGIGYDEHERALRNDQRRLSHFNKRETDKEKALAAKISILRDLTGYPKGKMYGGQGVPAPPGDGGAGAGDGGGGDTGGGAAPPPAPTGPPPIPPPPMPQWMISAGLGGPAAPMSGGFTFAPQAGLPEPVTYGSGYGGGRAPGYGGSGLDIGAVIAAIQAMHSDVVGAVGMVAPGTARGFDRSQNSMAARVAGRFA